jgi:hypothetical protein
VFPLLNSHSLVPNLSHPSLILVSTSYRPCHIISFITSPPFQGMSSSCLVSSFRVFGSRLSRPLITFIPLYPISFFNQDLHQISSTSTRTIPKTLTYTHTNAYQTMAQSLPRKRSLNQNQSQDQPPPPEIHVSTLSLLLIHQAFSSRVKSLTLGSSTSNNPRMQANTPQTTATLPTLRRLSLSLSLSQNQDQAFQL